MKKEATDRWPQSSGLFDCTTMVQGMIYQKTGTGSTQISLVRSYDATCYHFQHYDGVLQLRSSHAALGVI
jgi:hypothetical protein